MKQFHLKGGGLARLLESNLAPIQPRPEFVKSLRARLSQLPNVPVLVEHPRHWVRSGALVVLGALGVLASAGVAAASSVRVAGQLLGALGLLRAPRDSARPANRVHGS